ncbi:pseudouridine synthase [archaeon SCG-AAA382B04]|nr:pseudouridine synthase [archaeon SCG-AAA382B04]
MSLKQARKIANYQFGVNGEKFLPSSSKVKERRTGNIRYVEYEGEKLGYLRTNDGLFTLSIAGAKRLKNLLDYPKNRVVIQKEVEEFIEEGKSAFAKHVIEVDNQIRSRDEVLVVNNDDKLLGNGKAILSAPEIKSFEKGMAVDIRNGIKGGK